MPDANNDKYKLNRFIDAQQTDYAIALAEIKKGRKETHWMWYIFPQVMGLGYTGASITYSIKDINGNGIEDDELKERIKNAPGYSSFNFGLLYEFNTENGTTTEKGPVLYYIDIQ